MILPLEKHREIAAGGCSMSCTLIGDIDALLRIFGISVCSFLPRVQWMLHRRSNISCIDSFLVGLLIPGPRMSWENGRAHSELIRKQQLVLVPLVHPPPRTLYSSSPHSLITFHHIFQIQQFIFNNETRVRGAGFTAALVWRNRFSSFGFPLLQVARRSKQRFLATTQPQPWISGPRFTKKISNAF